MNNRMYNAKNPYQRDFTKVLCVCSAGLLRSPTAAVVLSQAPFNCNTRAAGIEESYALVPVDDVLVRWADEIVCMTDEHAMVLRAKFGEFLVDRPVYVLNVPDNFAYRDPKLMELIAARYQEQIEALEEDKNNNSEQDGKQNIIVSD